MKGHRIRIAGSLLLLLALFACGGPQLKDEDCIAADNCKRKGLCTADGSVCIATQEKDCRASRFCLNLGECTPKDGRCIATKEADCRNSTQCKVAKKCIPQVGTCVEINPQYCSFNWPGCKTRGECSLDSKNNTCVAKKQEDCQKSSNCQDRGECSLDEKTSRCVVKENRDCAVSTLCQKEGRCTASGPSQSRECVAISAQNCQESSDCKDKKLARCILSRKERRCLSTRERCKDQCVQEGNCEWSPFGFCVAVSDKDCQNSQACQLENRCKRSGDRCVRDSNDACASSTLCHDLGLCRSQVKNKATVCVAGSQSDCEKSRACWAFGRCKLDRGRCVFDSCVLPCRLFGRCIVGLRSEGRSCVATTDKDCAASLFCKRRGLCKRLGDSCAYAGNCTTACKEGGRCVKGKDRAFDVDTSKAMCVAATDADCAKSQACTNDGLCARNGTSCVAFNCSNSNACQRFGRCALITRYSQELCGPTSSTDCRKNVLCNTQGVCTYRAGRCIAGSNADCEQSAGCLNFGLCKADTRNGVCIAKTDEDCDFNACKRFGRCKVQWNEQNSRAECTITSDSDCAGSQDCKQKAQCIRRGNACVKASDCSTPCLRYGLCERVAEGGSFICRAKTNEDCQKSNDCRDVGNCKLRERACVPLSDSDCAGSIGCQLRGLCSLRGRQCVVSGCGEETTACKRFGRCTQALRGGVQQCVATDDKSCQSSIDCTERGLCKKDGDRCIFLDGQDCSKLTTACDKLGRCSTTQTNYFGQSVKMCATLSAKDCAKGSVCQSNGQCSSQDNACVALTSTDCAKGSKCKKDGNCTAKDGACIIASDADCAKTEDCKGQGLCGLINGSCQATKFEHCQNSTSCIRDGQCRFDAGASACKADPLSCKKSARCILKGWCGFDKAQDNCAFSGCEEKSEPCKRSGRCKETTEAGDKICVANDSKKCESSEDCKERGLCIYKSGDKACSFKDCKASSCERFGRCTASQTTYLGNSTSICVASAQDDCQNSENCTNEGKCHLKDGACVALSVADCTGSSNCTNEGRCSYKDNDCVLSNDSDCKKSSFCRDSGACKYRGGRCEVGNPLDCTNSNNCKEFGRCAVEQLQQQNPGGGPSRKAPTCVAKSCDQRIPACRVYGRCKSQKEAKTGITSCVANSTTSCKTSEVCKQQGRCQFVKGECQATSTKDCTNPCKLFGLCALARDKSGIGYCIALDDGACLRSQICTRQGKCTKDPQGQKCIANNSKNCQNSTFCRQKGLCALSSTKKECVAAAAKDCANSTECFSDGYCTRQNEACVAGSNTDCANSTNCKSKGACTNVGTECYPQKTADCTQSTLCQTQKLCRYSNGACIR